MLSCDSYAWSLRQVQCCLLDCLHRQWWWRGGTGGEGFCVEHAVLMKVKMLVEDVMSDKSKCPSLDWLSSRTPFVDGGGKTMKAVWVGEAKFHGFNIGC